MTAGSSIVAINSIRPAQRGQHRRDAAPAGAERARHGRFRNRRKRRGGAHGHLAALDPAPNSPLAVDAALPEPLTL